MDETRTEVHKKSRIWKWLLIMVIVVVVTAGGILAVLLAAEKYSGRSEFCGTQCHIMKPNYESWKKDKHSLPDKVTQTIKVSVATPGLLMLSE